MYKTVNDTINSVISVARKEIGTKEYPANSNKCKYNEAYYGISVSGGSYPWCVVFQWWCFKQAGLKLAFFNGAKTASCSTLYSYYKSKNMDIDKEDIKEGDFIFFNFNGGKTTQHIGLCIAYDGKYITTIDGNTGSSNEANGGAVMLRKRSAKYIVCAARPEYDRCINSSTVEGEEKMDQVTFNKMLENYINELNKKDAADWGLEWEEARKWAESQGIVVGTGNSNMQYQGYATRQAVILMLYRALKGE